MRYCRNCGSLLEDRDLYCSNCGEKTVLQEQTAYSADRNQSISPDMMKKLSFELAYCGTLFWLPLLVCPKDKEAKYFANQGLWILIFSVCSCTGIRMLSALNDFFAGSLISIITGAVYSLAFIIFLSFMIYLLWNVVKKAMEVHREEKPESILFFDDVQIIK